MIANKTNSGLLQYAAYHAGSGAVYWFGTYGQIATVSLYRANKARYPKYYTAGDFVEQTGRRAFDCSGLIKGYLWSTRPDGLPTYDARTDLNAAAFYDRATRKGELKKGGKPPEIPGMLVFKRSGGKITHVGIYDGLGGVYEARGHAFGVVHTLLKDDKKTPWEAWAQCSYICDDTSAALAAARDVIDGAYGNGAERVKRLTAAGYNAAMVQQFVNKLLQK